MLPRSGRLEPWPVRVVTTRRPLDDYVTPIVSGLTPQAGSSIDDVLSLARAAELREHLAELDRARRQAWLEIRSYGLAS